MKTKSLLCLILLIGLFLTIEVSHTQETKKAKKALDAFINATSKSVKQDIIVPNANVFIELLPNKKGSIKTNEKGEFAISFSDIENLQGNNSKVVRLRFSITPDQGFQHKTATKIIDYTLNKSEGSFFIFTLKYKQDTLNSSIGNFLVVHNSIDQGHFVKAADSTGKGAKQRKGSAVKTGDKYQGEVRHF